ncbi:hypothetical protein MC885_004054, partial [Smutsia gigantea]
VADKESNVKLLKKKSDHQGRVVSDLWKPPLIFHANSGEQVEARWVIGRALEAFSRPGGSVPGKTPRCVVSCSEHRSSGKRGRHLFAVALDTMLVPRAVPSVVGPAGTGTFGQVQLVKEKTAKHFFALKVMSIPDVIRLKQEQHVHNEKSVLKEVSHPFLVKLFWTWHDEHFLYMLMEFVPGGELFSYLRNRGRFSSNTGHFYSVEIVCAIEYLHSREIVYRDLKPENILLDRDGHIKLTDFGFAKKLVDKTWTLCGTPEYLAPEVIQSKGHGRAVDWWALGILIFEMLSGFPPFFDDNPFGIYQKILAGKIDFPRHLDFNVKDLIKKLLVVDRTRRLGNMKNGADDVKRHRWFRSVDWEAVPQRKLKPPIVPKVCGEGDISNFETYPENDWNTAPPVSPKDLEVFKNF